MSFYRRFSPHDFKDWPSFLEKDGEEFVHHVLDNVNIWSNRKERSRLERACWDCPDPYHNMDAQNNFRSREQDYREKFPQLFVDESDDPSRYDFDDIKERLANIEKALGENDDPNRQIFDSIQERLANVEETLRGSGDLNRQIFDGIKERLANIQESLRLSTQKKRGFFS